MKRDMDLVRELLLKVEGGVSTFEPIASDVAEILGVTPEVSMSREDADKLRGHLELIEEAGFLEIETRGGGGVYAIKRITWQGYEFLDSVRDPEIWAKTKKGAAAAGGFTVDLLKDLAIGFVKKQIEERTGVTL
jgi:hypothetical protein